MDPAMSGEVSKTFRSSKPQGGGGGRKEDKPQISKNAGQEAIKGGPYWTPCSL